MDRAFVCALIAAALSVGTAGRGKVTTTPATPRTWCALVATCRADTNCSACLNATRPYAASGIGFQRSNAEREAFFSVLVSTRACTPTATDPGIYWSAMKGLSNVYPHTCPGEAPALLEACQGWEYKCFLDNTCRECLSALRLPGANKADTLGTAVCVAAAGTVPWLELTSNCDPPVFPTCTAAKMMCRRTTNCTACWAALRRGNGVVAAAQCPSGGSAARVMDALVLSCTPEVSHTTCEYYSHRCTESAGCASCYEAISEAHGARLCQ